MRKKSILCVNITNKRSIGLMGKDLKCSARSKRAVATMMRIIKGGVPPGKVLKEVMSAEPKPYNEVITPSVLQGPVIQLGHTLESYLIGRQSQTQSCVRSLKTCSVKNASGGIYV